ncbi:MAG: AraC family transcriptional regulator N-terminal domain-containing protein [Hyphomicrobiales bacterium]
MSYTELTKRILSYANDHKIGVDPHFTEVPSLVVLKNDKPTTLDGVLYNPVMCLILQGRKETYVGERRLSFGAGESLIVSHDLPVMAQVTEASAEHPYIALAFSIDLQTIRSLYDEIEDGIIEDQVASAFNTSQADAELIGALERLFELVDRPNEAKVMLPLLEREIHFRMLMAQHGGMLRQLLQRDSQASRIAKAINRIKLDYATPFTVAELAMVAGMSASSFHEHFKAITLTTPLQYQKDIRLLQARRLVRDGDRSISAIAFEVGYESPTQFSREYARKFGLSPRNDLNVLEAALG